MPIKKTKKIILKVFGHFHPRLVMGDINKEEYIKIGESDRMTLKFIKP